MDAGIQLYVGLNTKELDQFMQRVDQTFKPLRDSAKDARNVLTSLSLVAQDLPFGFIGIQNNLPRVIQTFGDLKRESGGTKNALKELASGLVGPAGLFLAFSSVTAAITFAIQKYGSLGNAIDSILFSVDQLSEKYKDINKSLEEYNKFLKDSNEITLRSNAGVQDRIAYVNVLAKGASDLTKSEQDRSKYLNELVTVDKNYFSQLKQGKVTVDEINEATKRYTQSILTQARAEGIKDEIKSVSQQIAQQKVLKVELEARRKAAELIDKQNIKTIQSSAALGGANTALKSGLDDAKKAVTASEQEIKKLEDREKQLNNQLTEAVDNLLKFKINLDDSSSASSKLSKNLEENEYWLKGLSKAAIDWIRREFAANELAAINAELLKRAEAYKLLEASTFAAADAQMNLDGTTNNLMDSINTFSQELGMLQDMQFGLSEFTKNIFDNIGIAIKNFQENIALVYPVLYNSFFSPLEGAFTEFLNTGKLTFDNFGKMVMDSIKKTLARVAASGIIALLSTILSGGFAAGTGTSGFQFVGNAILGALGVGRGAGGLGRGTFPGLGGIASPSFGGIGAGALSMGGQVNLTLRGADLVGSLNRTNTIINRIG